MLPRPNEEKDYPIGKSEERLQNVPASAVAWRVSLTCDQLTEGEAAVITVYHLRNGEYAPIRSIKLSIPKGGLKNKDGTLLTEFVFGGEYPYELEALDKNGRPTKGSFDGNGRPKYRYLKADEFKVEIDAQVPLKTEVKIAALESRQIRAALPGVPTRTILPDGSFRL